jgi:hypothetical protein
VHLESLAVRLVTLEELLFDVRFAGGREQGRKPVFVGSDLIADGSRLDHTRSPDRARYPIAAFPVGVLLAAKWGGAAVGPGHAFGAVVGRVHDDRVVGDAEFVELLQQLSDVAVVLDRIDPDPGFTLRLLLEVSENVRTRGVPPAEERLLFGWRAPAGSGEGGI